MLNQEIMNDSKKFFGSHEQDIFYKRFPYLFEQPEDYSNAHSLKIDDDSTTTNSTGAVAYSVVLTLKSFLKPLLKFDIISCLPRQGS